MNSLPEKINASGKSDAALAEAVGVMRMTIWRWRKGHTRPSYEQIVPLARALECDVDALLNGEARDAG